MPQAGRDAFEIRLNPEETKGFVDEVIEELHDAWGARATLDDDAAYWMQLYEQQRTRLAQNMPWPDSADLTSYLGTEKVDALHARLLRTIFTEPVCAVEGWGEAADRAPIVEEFHQWKMEEERLQSVVDRAFLLSLIEPIGIHEVVEGTETRMVRERVTARLARDPLTGAAMLDDQGQPVLERDEQGDIVTAEAAEPGTAETIVDRTQPIRTGPVHKVVPFRDFYMLPGHARDRSEVWAYAKRFYRRLPEIQQRAKDGIYDEEAVTHLTDAGEHSEAAEEQRAGITVVNTNRGTLRSAEKELWELLLLWDFEDGEGERWYLATVHVPTRQLLRLQYDDLGAKRYVLYVPIPRPDSVYGYSLVGDKLITIIEEHTAWRNMNTDKASMAVMGPILRKTGSLWDPDEQPMGPKSIIDVRQRDEIVPLVLPDVPAGAMHREEMTLRASERVAGINDTATGQTAQSGTTLGEVQLVAQQSFVRMDTVIHRIQESIEDLYQIRHLIWQRVLAEQEKGADLPAQALTGLESRGIQVPEGGITAETLSGAFRFKPRGSVESADLGKKRQDLVQMVQFFAQLAQVSPVVAQKFQNPEFVNALLEEMIRVFGFENRQALLGTPGEAGQAVDGDGNPLEQLLGQFGGSVTGEPTNIQNPVLSGDDRGIQ
jgi:hypothetical protein